MKKSFKDFLPLITKVALVISVIVGYVATSTAMGPSDQRFMSAATLLYFTIQSNLLIGAICLVFAVFDVMKLCGKAFVVPLWLHTVKFVCTVGITLTFVVFAVILAPVMLPAMPEYLYSASNIFCHNLVPILAILDWIFFEEKYPTKKYSFLFGTILPLYYLAFAMIGSVTGVDFGEGQKVPYYFFDYEANGWFNLGKNADGVFQFGVAYWITLLVALVIGLSFALLALQKCTVKKAETEDESAVN